MEGRATAEVLEGQEEELEPELWDVARPGTRPYRPVGSSKDFPPLEGIFSTNTQQDYHLRAADGLVSPFHATPGPQRFRKLPWPEMPYSHSCSVAATLCWHQKRLYKFLVQHPCPLYTQVPRLMVGFPPSPSQRISQRDPTLPFCS